MKVKKQGSISPTCSVKTMMKLSQAKSLATKAVSIMFFILALLFAINTIAQPINPTGDWRGLPASWNSGIDAAIFLESSGKIYFFKGNQYVRLTGEKVDRGYPKSLPGDWRGIPASWNSGIDAAISLESNGKIYFFKGNQYVRLTGTKVDRGYPKALPDGWRGLPASWNSGIDAAMFLEFNGKIYFFKDNQYVRLTGTKVDRGYPKALPGGWRGLPASWNSGIDAAISTTGHAYFFKGSRHARFSGTKLDPGYPQAFAATEVSKVFDFEDERLAPRTTITTQYAKRGVRFVPSAYLDNDNLARSGSRVLRAANPATEFHTEPLKMKFSSGQSLVKMYARARYGSTKGTLKAFDAGGTLVGKIGPKTIATSGYTTEFKITAGSAIIRRVELQYSGTAFEAIDDLELRGKAPGPLPTTPPHVQIDTPTANQQLTNAEITLSGVITGEEVLSPVRFKIQVQRPPGSTVPTTSTSWLQLGGSGDSRTFSLSHHSLGLGPQTLTVRAENSAGLSHSQSVQVTYLPQAIRDRVDSEGASTLGSFLFGSGYTDECSYAVYQRGAVAKRFGTTHVVRGAILDKWLAEKDLSGYPSLGCPTSEERSVPGDDARVQYFQKAYIYADASGVYQVPMVFVQAISARVIGREAFAIPTEDPSKSIGAMQTWLFQRFRHAGRSEPEATIEIRGTPPRLYMERKANYPGTSVPAPYSPTIVEQFPCSDYLGPCGDSVPDEQPLDDLGRFCNYEHFNWEAVKDALLGEVTEIDLDPPEWVAIAGDHVQTPLRGIITEAFLSIEDNPFTHEYPEDCPKPGAGLTDCLEWAARKIAGAEPSECCPSDWHINVSPLPGWRHLLGVGPGSSSKYRDKMPVEYESRHAQAFTAFGGDPHPGDLMFASGRWIVDCGHDYKTEIHPPSIMAFMRTSTYEGKVATLAYVWVNGFYSGDPVELDINAPPRPSPDAHLTVVKEEVTPHDVTVTQTHSWLVKPYQRLQFWASPRRVEVTAAGEMKWDTGRDYKGRWWVYWEIP